ncbi:MAG: WD40 repeat domain-containing protein [bacterium]
MKTKNFIIFSLVLFSSFFAFNYTLAEDKNAPGVIIPKLQKTANDPELFNNFVYPMWGPICQRYAYNVTYRDKEGRQPEYMRIIFNGKPIDMNTALPRASLDKQDYQKGVRYEYKFVPNKIGSNFYYFEASNGVGKARAAIIDSPDNGPVLFEGDFLQNEIAVLDSETGKKILSYPTKEEWVGGVSLSDDGKYLAAKTSYHIYLFDLENPKEPKWTYKYDAGSEIGGDLKGGVAISGDGSRIIASIASSILFFNNSNNKPIWRYDIIGNAYNVAISKDGKYMAAATGGTESNINTNLLISWSEKSEKPLWQYHSSGNFHDVSLSNDGKYIAGSTGCPDRRYYLFSRDSNQPLMRSEMLTRDSPVHRAKISTDGSFTAVGSESDAGAVFLFSKNSKEPIWKFPTANNSSVRALNFTPDGQYIGASTLSGHAYIFGNASNQPIATWTFNAALGGIDIADDGSFIVAGGTDNKIHILSKDKKINLEVLFEEYVEEIDISANGKHVAIGTGGSVYFFETISEDAKAVTCATITEPKPLEEMMTGGSGTEEQIKYSNCGDNKCEGPETIDNCKKDCDTSLKSQEQKLALQNNQRKFPGMLFGFGFFGSALLLGIFIAFNKLKFFERQRKTLRELNIAKLAFFKLTGKKIIIFLLILTILFLFLTITAVFLNSNFDAAILKTDKQTETEPDKIITNQEEKPILNEDRKKGGICGNNICESDLKENKESCPEDCSAGD